MSIRDQWARQRDRDEAAVGKSIAAIMRDTRWDRLRGLRTRRGLVVAFAVALALVLPTQVYAPAILPLVPLLAATGLYVLLRLATRVLPDAPPEYLDERQRVVQAQTYLSAFRLVATVLVLAGTAAFVVTLFSTDPDTFVVLSGLDAVAGLNMTLVGLLLAAPTCVYAWQQPET